MNTTLSTLSVQRLNHAVNQVVNAMPGSSPSVTTESDQLNVSADKSSACMYHFDDSVIIVQTVIHELNLKRRDTVKV